MKYQLKLIFSDNIFYLDECKIKNVSYLTEAKENK